VPKFTVYYMKSKYQTFLTVQIKKAKTEATLEIILDNLGQNLKCCMKKIPTTNLTS